MINLDEIRERLERMRSEQHARGNTSALLTIAAEEFIAHAPEDIGALLAEIERLRIAERTALARLEFDCADAQGAREALQAENERLRNLTDLQRRLADRRNENLVKLTAENECLQAELAAARNALPDAGLLERAGAILRFWNDPSQANKAAAELEIAAVRIRAAQEARGEV